LNNSSGFRLIKTCFQTKARAGELATPHGVIATPVFLPVGSQGAVKTLTPDEVKSLGFSMVLANTYHLYLRPGIDVIEKLGGLNKFMGWEGAILTDSGGYQVFSLASLRQVSDEGVTFRSHIDGSQHNLTPELAINYQEALGADIIMALDECPAHDESLEKVKRATERTHKWAERCLKAHERPGQALYAIVQGGLFPELRRQSAEYLVSLDFPGYAIGGLSLGEPKKITFAMVEETVALLPENKPRYLMGVGSPEDIVEAVARGCDIFDSALPTRVARNGALFTWRGRVNITNAAYADMEEPVVSGCGCYCCRNFSAAYLHHLFNAGELLAYRLATIHNLSFVAELMNKIRGAIEDSTFADFKKEFLAGYRPTDEPTRLGQKRKWRQKRNSSQQGLVRPHRVNPDPP
jgi:queuine tRNA-ribosyltransferase